MLDVKHVLNWGHWYFLTAENHTESKWKTFKA